MLKNQPNVVWYATYDDAMKGNNPLSQNMPLVHGTTYYAVIIGTNGCPSLPTPIEAIIVLGVNDFDLSKLKYYPNPVSDQLTITYTEVITNVEVFDLNGRMVMKRNFDKETVQLDFSTLSSGTYMLNIKTKENSQFIKIVRK
ncbi:MAG: T9SS type A sorting domain-containing protein, partial [Myroides sp.]